MAGSPHIGKCRLCLAGGVELQESHIIPRWAFNRVRGPAENPAPVVTHNGRAFRSTKHIKERLLCAGCEQRFCPAEDRISRIVYQSDGSAPILDLVGPVSLATEQGTRAVGVGRLDADDLCFFGASVLWRACVSSVFLRCNLGTYREAFRRYLLHETGFPDRTAVVVAFHEAAIGRAPELEPVITSPCTTRAERHHWHRFAICGLLYYFAVGEVLPVEIVEFCLHHRTEKMVLLAREERAFEWLGNDLARAKPVGRLARE